MNERETYLAKSDQGAFENLKILVKFSDNKENKLEQIGIEPKRKWFEELWFGVGEVLHFYYTDTIDFVLTETNE